LCGICGEVRFDGGRVDHSLLKVMCDAQLHRGPDDEGYYVAGSVGLGIRRLAIIDLRKGLYPITNESGLLHLVFNGEIYGFKSFRTDLERLGHTFSTNTDAETVLHAYEEWGTNGCLTRLNGMFAFALWDDQQQLLWIARDHFGIKPLYYHCNKDRLVFASEIKPLIARKDFASRPNEEVVRSYLESSRVDDTENTFFEGIKQLRPAHQMVAHWAQLAVERYWLPSISHSMSAKKAGMKQEANTLRELFLGAVEQQLVSDVPVGSCLSGGLDSSSIVCAASQQGASMKTFSAVFPSFKIDETAFVKTVCEETGAEYNPVEPTAEKLWEDLPTLVRCQEEPFVTTSIYAQFRVMQLAKQHGVTVVLDGQGSDELLCGYIPLYLHYLMRLWTHHKYWRLIKELAGSYDLTKPFALTRIKRYAKYLLRISRFSTPNLRSSWASPAEDDLPRFLEILTSIHGLPALLRYEDKNSMWHSIEARVPFLDRPFFEFAAALPLDRKLRDGWTKYIFREAMRGILPEKIRLRRSKIGFETPEHTWITRDLRWRIANFFETPTLHATYLYDLKKIKEILRKDNLNAGEVGVIWRTLNLEMWWEAFFPRIDADE
jgi:asparagine synthase (glutamine-hydrolysing)